MNKPKIVIIVKKDLTFLYAAVIDMIKAVCGELWVFHMSFSILEDLMRFNLVRFRKVENL